MDEVWIGLAVFAALSQAVRTAAQKALNARMSAIGTTYVRSLFGLPVMLIYLGLVLGVQGGGVPALNGLYLLHTFLGALAQVVATVLLVMMFRLKNFAVGTMLTKVDIVITALIGTVLFSERLSLAGFAALLIVVAGVVLMSRGKLGPTAAVGAQDGWREALFGRATRIALSCATIFAFSFLFLREATLVLGPGHTAAWRGAWTVVIATSMQVIGVSIWLLLREPGALAQIRPNWKLSAFIGGTSALGSIAWFTAFALQNASYVRAVGQIEVVFTVLISWLWFREVIRPLELAGIAITIVGILMFRLAA